MKKTLAVTAVATIMATHVHAAPRWEEAVHQCYAMYVQKWEHENGVSCGSCAAGWPFVTRCAAAVVFPQAKPELVDWCISVSEARYRERPMSEERVSPTLACVNAGH